MQNVVQLFPHTETLVIPGLVAYGIAQQGRDTFKYAKNKKEAFPWLDEVMDMKRDVESFNETLDPKIQVDNHSWYVEALIMIFPIYYHLGEMEKAKKAYLRACRWAEDGCLLGIPYSSSRCIEDKWSDLEMPWHGKVWRQFLSLCIRIGESQIVKWKARL